MTVYVSKICIPMEGIVEQMFDDTHAILRITPCRDTKSLGRRIFADLNYWRKTDNGNDENHVRTGKHQDCTGGS